MTTSVKNYEVIIAGAGPAGSSLAIRLAMEGFAVLLVEQKRFPRAKLCGEFISPECAAHFSELVLAVSLGAAGAVNIDRTVFYARRGASVSVPSEWFASGQGALGLSRAEMDMQMLARARDVGVTVIEEVTAKPHMDATGAVDGVSLRHKTGVTETFAATLTIDATGRASALARIVSPQPTHRTAADFVAFKTRPCR